MGSLFPLNTHFRSKILTFGQPVIKLMASKTIHNKFSVRSFEHVRRPRTTFLFLETFEKLLAFNMKYWPIFWMLCDPLFFTINNPSPGLTNRELRDWKISCECWTDSDDVVMRARKTRNIAYCVRPMYVCIKNAYKSRSWPLAQILTPLNLFRAAPFHMR